MVCDEERDRFLGSIGKNVPRNSIAVRNLPSLILDNQKLGGVTSLDMPYLIGGNWNVINLTASYGHVVIHGFADRLILNSAPGIFARVYGVFTHIEARNFGCDSKGHRSWIELNGDILELDLRGNSVREIGISSGTYEVGGDVPAWARRGEVNPINERLYPLRIGNIRADNPNAWRRAIADVRRAIREQLNPLE